MNGAQGERRYAWSLEAPSDPSCNGTLSSPLATSAEFNAPAACAGGTVNVRARVTQSTAQAEAVSQVNIVRQQGSCCVDPPRPEKPPEKPDLAKDVVDIPLSVAPAIQKTGAVSVEASRHFEGSDVVRVEKYASSPNGFGLACFPVNPVLNVKPRKHVAVQIRVLHGAELPFQVKLERPLSACSECQCFAHENAP